MSQFFVRLEVNVNCLPSSEIDGVNSESPAVSRFGPPIMAPPFESNSRAQIAWARLILLKNSRSPMKLGETSNACAERFVRSIKESCLDRMIFFGEQSLRTAIQTFAAHYHSERNHQGLANQLISPEPGILANTGEVQRRQHMGGMLNYYYRAAA
jgi:hypothetical protein